MLRVHLMQNWFGYSDPAMEEALYQTAILRHFTGLNLDRIPDETTILNFRRLLEKHELAAGILAVINGYLGDRGLSLRQGTIVDATLIHAPSSTKNQDGKRGPTQHVQEAWQAQRLVQSDSQNRKSQSPGAGKGRASISRDQAAVRLHQGALSRIGQDGV